MLTECLPAGFCCVSTCMPHQLLHIALQLAIWALQGVHAMRQRTAVAAAMSGMLMGQVGSSAQRLLQGAEGKVYLHLAHHVLSQQQQLHLSRSTCRYDISFSAVPPAVLRRIQQHHQDWLALLCAGCIADRSSPGRQSPVVCWGRQ